MEDIHNLYKDYIISPKRKLEEILKTVKSDISLESVTQGDIEEFYFDISHIEKDKSYLCYFIKKEKCGVYFYKELTSHYANEMGIYLFYDESSDSYHSNSIFFQLFMKYLQGVDEIDVEKFSPAYKTYLNIYYLFNLIWSQSIEGVKSNPIGLCIFWEIYYKIKHINSKTY